MGRRSDHTKEELKDLIVSAARNVIREDGYSGLSARRVAGEIGYTVGTLYHNFKNINEIVLHVNALTLDDLYQAMREACEKRTEAGERAVAIGVAYIDFAFKHRNLWRAIYEMPITKESPVPDWYHARVTRTLEYVAIQLAPLVKNPVPREMRRAAYMIWCGIHGMCVLSIGHQLEVPRAELGMLATSFIKDYVSGLVLRDVEKVRANKREEYVQ